MTKKIARIIGVVMLVIAIVFVAFALGHPEMGFPWCNSITYIIYGVYLIVMLIMFFAPFPNE